MSDQIKPEALSVIKALADLAKQGRVGFVDDGINDTPALAAVDVGIAMGSRTAVAIEAANVVLMLGQLRGVATTHRISPRTLSHIRQNLVWAPGINVALIPLAAGLLAIFGLSMLSPMLASGAMAASSVLVITNGLRLRRLRAVFWSGGPCGWCCGCYKYLGNDEAEAVVFAAAKG